MAAELMVMQKLLSVPANRQKLANFTSNQLMPNTSIPVASGQMPAGYNAPFVLDAWGNPMIYVPAGNRLDGVWVTGPGALGTERIHPIPISAPDGRGFWASAGPDGIFSRTNGADGVAGTTPTFGDDVAGGDDNVYSFQQ
jgi:hypothetical protein